MKNKGLTYGLIVVVGVVWYQVFMRVKSNLETTDTLPLRTTENMLSRKIVKPDPFKLQANYRDPFSGSMDGITAAPNPDQQIKGAETSLPKPKPEPIYVQWPSIRYYGLVRKTTAANARTLLAIDGSFYKVLQGENVLDDIYILKVTRDYVQIRYKKETKTFSKIN